MIKSLRQKFILIAMLSIIIVLGIIVSIINIANYHNVNSEADETLTMIAENGGEFPSDSSRDKSDKKKHDIPDISPEAPFETRYFTVTLDSDGSITEVNLSRISAVSSDKAKSYASQLYEKQKTSGFIGHYKYLEATVDGKTMYIFLDCSRDLSTFYTFLWVSIGTSVAGIVLVFILVVLFSKMAVKPFAENYEKQKRFITDASHEIKTPLTIIDANTEVLEMENGENEWTASTRNQIKRLTALTERLVFLSRMDEEQSVFQMIDFSLSDAVFETAQPYEAVAAASGKKFKTDIEKNITYCGDETSLRHMVSMLLDNAMKYSDDEGNILISLKSSGKYKTIIVSNTVESIQKGNLDVLFERFYRMDDSRNSQTGGNGIGLSVVKAVVTSHKGKITARSEDGKSIVFKIVL